MEINKNKDYQKEDRENKEEQKDNEEDQSGITRIEHF